MTKLSNSMHDLLKDSALSCENAAYLEQMLELYLTDSGSVGHEWQEFFSELAASNADLSHSIILAEIKQALNSKYIAVSGAGTSKSNNVDKNYIKKQVGVLELINAYRSHGHIKANIDPLGMYEPPTSYDELTLAYHNLSDADLDTEFEVRSFASAKTLTLRKLLSGLEQAYCSSVGVEYMHIANEQERHWLQGKIEHSYYQKNNLSNEDRLNILDRLTAAEGLEKYLGAKYPGAKRFSVEGGESLIVSLDEIIQTAGHHGCKEIVVGMAHRGRLNVLVNNLGKEPGDLFDEFEGKLNEELNSGDVKYHQGFSADVKTKGGNVHISLAFNPSHLEIVAPVVTGSVRARQTKYQDKDQTKILPIIIHGDSAVAGQGVVAESFNMSQTRGYGIGGTIHIVVNNQVGFTTSNTHDTRSTIYCTDIAKSVQAPIFHVNGDDPDAVLQVTRLATHYRNKFKKDVVIDLVCYRRHGHNESDDPSATQPLMYQIIKKLPTTRKLYADKLVGQGVLSAENVKEMVAKNRASLDSHECVARNIIETQDSKFDWSPYISNHEHSDKLKTSVDLKTLESLYSKIADEARKVDNHNRVQKILDDRLKMIKGELPLDWGFAENMAYATLLADNYAVRISGQDSGRGTFFHRHAVLHDQKTAATSLPLHSVNPSEHLEVIDSVLSEEAVLAFEYGYACTDPRTLVIWEAQFGDFANGAQVVIDQFISSGEHKWGRFCSLAMLLPHGYEGMGPEHSSARLERFLQLCADKNMLVCVPSTPAQAFHMLRRQMVSKVRKPLIVMSPKSLLRHKQAVSSLEDLSSGEFKHIIGHQGKLSNTKVSKAVLCSGKVYYDLKAYQDENKIIDTALIRVEQLYPFPEQDLTKELAQYKNLKQIVWCQEEPKNQGAWYCSKHHFEKCLQKGWTLKYAGRAASSSPAVGYSSLHNSEQEALVLEAFS